MAEYSFIVKDVTVTVSLEDAERVKQWSWWLGPGGYVKGHVDRRPILLHHFIIGKPEQGYVVDHINNHKSDNRRENLRFATYAQNAQNTKRIGSTSKFKGVSKVSNGWTVSVASKYIGTFPCETAAARAYNHHARQTYGEGAALNDITMPPDYTFEYTKRKSPSDMSRRYDRPSTFGIRYKECGKKKVRWFQTEDQAEEFRLTTTPPVDKTIVETARDCHGTAVVILNTGKHVLVDDDQWNVLNHMTWHEYNKYAFNGKGEAMHRLLCLSPVGTVVDHRNGDKLDNRLHNLRTASFSDNSQNKAKKKGCSSRYIGVYRTEGKWRAYIKYQYNTYSLGCFLDEATAARAYNDKAKELYDHPRLNDLSS